MRPRDTLPACLYFVVRRFGDSFELMLPRQEIEIVLFLLILSSVQHKAGAVCWPNGKFQQVCDCKNVAKIKMLFWADKHARAFYYIYMPPDTDHRVGRRREYVIACK